MKIKLLILFLGCAFFSNAQDPLNYLYRPTRERIVATMADSSLGVPAGAFPRIANGGSGRAGQTYVDTVGGGQGLWYFRGNTWYHVLDSASAGGGSGGSGIHGVYNGFGLGKTNDSTLYADTSSGKTFPWSHYYKYKDSADATFTPMSRTLNVGYGILGGGNLTANRTFTADTSTLFPAVRLTIPGGSTPNLLQVTTVGNTADTIQLTNTATFKKPTKIGGRGDSNSTITLVSNDSLYYVRYGVYQGISLGNIIDRAFSGRGSYANIENHHGTIDPGHSEMTIFQGVYNDPRRSGYDRKMLNQAANATAAMIVNQFLKIYTAAGATATTITRTGGSTGYASNSVGGKTTNGWSTAAANDSIRYVNTGYDNFVYTITGGDSVNQAFARFTYRLYDVTSSTMVTYGTATSNQQWSGISDGTNNNQRGPMSFYFGGLNSTHTYRLTLVSNQSTNTFAVDYFGHLESPSNCVPIVIVGPVHMTAGGYATSPANATSPIMDSFNVHLDSTLTAFKNVMGSTYPAFFINPNSSSWGAYQFNPATDMGADGIHINDLGHRKEAVMVITTVPTILKQYRNGTISNDGTAPYYWKNGIGYPMIGGSSSGSSVTAGWGLYDSSGVIGNYFQKGVSGGNTLTFGTGAGDNGVIRTTSNASPTGKLYFKNTSSSYYDAEYDRWSFGGNAGQPAAVTITGNNSLPSHAVLYLKGQTSATGDILSGFNAGGTKLFQLQASGAIGIGMGDWAGSYPGQGAYFFVNGGINLWRNYNNSAWVPVKAEASTWTWAAGSNTTFMNTNSSGRTFFGGTTSATALVQMRATTEQLRLEYDGSNYMSVTVGSTGSTTLDLIGTTPSLIIPDSLRLTAIAQNIVDTTNWKPLVISAGGYVKKMPWAFVGGGSSVVESDYTPTVTNTTNITGTPVPSSFHYIRTGNSVKCWGTVTINITASATLTTFEIDLPIASAFTTAENLVGNGIGAQNSAAMHYVGLIANSTTAIVRTVASTSGNRALFFSFDYEVK